MEDQVPYCKRCFKPCPKSLDTHGYCEECRGSRQIVEDAIMLSKENREATWEELSKKLR